MCGLVHRPCYRFVVVLLAALMYQGIAQAQEVAKDLDFENAPTAAFDLQANRLVPWYRGAPGSRKPWTVELGVEVGLEPDYVGSDDYAVEPMPGARLLYNLSDSWRVQITPQTLGFTWDMSDKTLVQLVFEAEEGRETGDTRDLKMLREGRSTIEAELTLAHRFGQQRQNFVYATYQPEVQDRGKGVVTFIGMGRQFLHRPKLRVTGVVDLSWGDAEHMQTEFGLSAAEASSLGVAAYRPSGAIKSTTIGVTTEWNFRPRWALLAGVELEHYFSEAADSPLLAELGARTTFEVDIELAYRF